MNEDKKWILDDDHNLKEVDLMTWARWFEEASESGKRIVAQTEMGDFVVSTVFLGIDHSFGFGDAPLVFETMVVQKSDWYKGKVSDCWMDRSSTWAEAEKSHRQGLRWAGCCGPFARKGEDK